MMTKNEFIPIGDAAEILGVSRVTLRRLDKAGLIPTAHRDPRTGTRFWREEEIETIRRTLRPRKMQPDGLEVIVRRRGA